MSLLSGAAITKCFKLSDLKTIYLPQLFNWEAQDQGADRLMSSECTLPHSCYAFIFKITR